MANINKLWIVLSLVVAESIGCSHQALRSHEKNRIYNGNDASPGQFPYFVYIEVEDSKNSEGDSTHEAEEGTFFICGGSLIGEEWVLTAAHCVLGGRPVDVYLGSVDDDYEENYTIMSDKISIYPGYEKLHSQHDVALLRIPKTILCDKVDIIRLPQLISSSEYPKYEDEYALVAGFGMINSEDNAEQLQWARMKIIDNTDCSNYLQPISNEKICAVSLTNLASPSFGDSGGPLVLESTGELVGITVAISELGADKDHPSVFARVTDYLEWIKSITGIYY